jgi:segregation and condensation protein B
MPAGEESFAEQFERHEGLRLQSLVEAAIFASPEPVTVRQLARALQEPEESVQQLIDTLTAEYKGAGHGVCIRYTRGGYQMSTKPEYGEALHDLLRGLRPRAPLSMAALQTLAIIAYRQPISAPEIQAIRRVEGAGVLDTLLKRKLIAPAGYKPEARALLYKTTPQFLRDFGLKDLKELSALPELGELRERYSLDDSKIDRSAKSPAQ